MPRRNTRRIRKTIPNLLSIFMIIYLQTDAYGSAESNPFRFVSEHPLIQWSYPRQHRHTPMNSPANNPKRAMLDFANSATCQARMPRRNAIASSRCCCCCADLMTVGMDIEQTFRPDKLRSAVGRITICASMIVLSRGTMLT